MSNLNFRLTNSTELVMVKDIKFSDIKKMLFICPDILYWIWALHILHTVRVLHPSVSKTSSIYGRLTKFPHNSKWVEAPNAAVFGARFCPQKSGAHQLCVSVKSPSSQQVAPDWVSKPWPLDYYKQLAVEVPPHSSF